MRVVINIDDVDLNLFLADRAISKMCDDVVVHNCTNGQAGLDLYEELISSGNEVHLIVCDYHMPGLSGLDVLKEVRKIGDTPFAILTADNTVSLNDFPGADYVFYKPFHKKDIKKLFLYSVCTECKKCFKDVMSEEEIKLHNETHCEPI
jgi:CheY-like chemotaxis protein